MILARVAVLIGLALVLGPRSALGQTSQAQGTAEALPGTVRALGSGTPLRSGPGVNSPIVITVAAGTLLDVTGRDGDWYRITLAPDMVADPTTPRTVYVLARLVEPVKGSQGSIAAPPPQTPAATVARPETLRAQPARAAVTGDGSIGWCVLDDGGSANPACVTGSGVWWGKSWAGFVFESTYDHLTRSSGVPVSVGLLVTDAGVRFGVNMGPHARLVYGIVAGSAWFRVEGVNSFDLAFKPALGVEIDLSNTHAVAIRPQVESINVRFDGLWAHDVAFSVDIVWRSFRQ